MFIGHFGAGLAAKKLDSKPSLGTLFLASQFIDLIWPIFLLLGIEQVKIAEGNTAFTPMEFVYYPFTHSLLGVLFWATAFLVIHYIFKKNSRTALLLGGLVISHWILDLLTHSPDLPIAPRLDIKLGLGLWNSVLFTVIIELSIFALGTFLYLKVTAAKNKIGKYSLWGLVIFLLMIYFSNVFGPPPPSEAAVAWAGNLQWKFVAWAYWIDKNRK